MSSNDPWSRLRSRRGVVAAVVVGGVLRLIWVVVATRGSQNPFSDPSEYLSMALGFGRGDLPRFHGGASTAWFPPGYSVVLAPFVTIADLTGVASAVFTASLVNAAAGTATIVVTSRLAELWMTARAGLIAAWIMALAPAQIMFTSTAHSETVFTLFAALIVLIASHWALRRGVEGSADVETRGPGVPISWQVGLGALVGFTGLIRSPGVLLLAVPPLLLHAVGVSWARSLRALAPLVVGALLVLAPWAVRNGVQLDHWSPFSTNNASAICIGHHPDFMEGYDSVEFRISLEAQRDCFTGSPYDDARLGVTPPGWVHGTPAEAEWYREATAWGIRSALEHPVDEIGWTGQKLRTLVLGEDGVVQAARNFSDDDWAGAAEAPLMWLAVAWLLSVEVLAVVGAVQMRRRPGILVLAGCAVAFLVVPVIAVAYPHQHHPAMPFLVVLAAGALARVGLRDGSSAAGSGPVGDRLEDRSEL